MHGSTDYKVGDIVAAPFVEDKSFYRARVEEVEEDKLDLYFLDFGDSEFVNASEVFPLRFVIFFVMSYCFRAYPIGQIVLKTLIFYCATVACHVELNAISDGHGIMANIQEN